MARWAVGQFGDVIDRFRPDCPAKAWDDVLMRYSVLVEKGPLCGSLVAKKLASGKDIWELLGHADNAQPRLLFYFVEARPLIVFVHAFIKQGKNEYKRAIALAHSRRRLIGRGEKSINVIKAFTATQIH